MSINHVIYAVQIIVLSASIAMVWRSRRAMNGLARGLILLAALLIIRRIDEFVGYLDDTGSLVISSVIVGVLFFDIWKVYHARWLYELWNEQRQQRIADLEEMRARSERGYGEWDHQKVSRRVR